MKNILIIKCGTTFPEIKEKHGEYYLDEKADKKLYEAKEAGKNIIKY